MATWATFATMAAILLPAALAGCVKPEDPSGPSECPAWASRWCEPQCGPECCIDCGSPPTPPTPRTWPTPCAVCDCPPNADCACPATGCCFDVCGVPPSPPLLNAIDAIVLGACDACASAAVVATPDGRLAVATESTLFVRAPDGRVAALAREPGFPEPDARRSPSLSFDADGRLWWAALATRGALPELELAAWEGDDLVHERTFTLVQIPLLALAQRAWTAATSRELVLVLAAEDAAWAVRSFDGGETFGLPEALTPQGGIARLGAPVRDAADRVLVPYAWTPRDPLQGASSLVAPASWSTSLHYTVLETSGVWTQRGGFGIAQPLAPGTRPSLAMGRDGGAFAWTDASGIARRIESWDDGMSWGPPIQWSDPLTAVAGDVASARDGPRGTLAWWDEEGAFTVARSDGGAPIAAQRVTTLDATPPDTALALAPDGRAVVAWVARGEAWLGLER